MSETSLYPNVSNFDRVYTVKRNNKFPIDINSVKHSLNDLELYLNDKTSDAYPGQLVAIDDDLTSDIFVDSSERKNIGVYYIYYDKQLKKLQYKKISFEQSIDELIENPWEVMYDNNQSGPNIYNKDEKLNNNIISEYNKSGVSINITPLVTNKQSNKV